MYFINDRVRVNMEGVFKGEYGTVTSVGSLDWYEVRMDRGHRDPLVVSFKKGELVPEGVPVTDEEWAAFEAWWLKANQ